MTRPCTYGLFLIALSLLVNLELFAQDVQTYAGPQISLGKHMSLAAHIHSDSSRHFFLLQKKSGRGNHFSILALDQDYNELWQKNFAPFSNEWSHLDIFFANEQIVWVGKMHDSRKKQVFGFYQIIEANGQVNDPVTAIKSKPASRRSQMPRLRYNRNEDSGDLAFIMEYDDDDKKTKMKWSVVSLDAALTSSETKNYVLPYTQRKVETQDYLVSSNGMVYIAIMVFNNKKGRRYKTHITEEIADFNFELIQIDPNTQEMERQKMKVDGLVPRGLSMRENQQGQLILAGLYSYFAKWATKGYYYYLFDPALQDFTRYVEYDFSERELDDFGKRSTIGGSSKRKGLNPSFTITNILSDTKGGHYTVLENQYQTSRIDPFSQMTTIVYHADDMISIYVNMGGEVSNTELIPKLDGSLYPQDLGHRSFMIGDELALIYNDNIKNLESSERDTEYVRSTGRNKNTLPVLTTLNESRPKTVALLTEKESGEFFYPLWTKGWNDNQIMGFTYEYTGRAEGFIRILEVGAK